MQQTHQWQADVTDEKNTTKQHTTKIVLQKINTSMPLEGKSWRVLMNKFNTLKFSTESTASRLGYKRYLGFQANIGEIYLFIYFVWHNGNQRWNWWEHQTKPELHHGDSKNMKALAAYTWNLLHVQWGAMQRWCEWKMVEPANLVHSSEWNEHQLYLNMRLFVLSGAFSAGDIYILLFGVVLCGVKHALKLLNRGAGDWHQDLPCSAGMKS